MSGSISRRKVLAGFAAAGAASIAMPAVLRAQSGPIKIGCLAPLSGPQEIYGREVKVGAEIAVDQINAAGGVGGRMLELQVRDDKANPNDAVFATRELAGSGVNLFTGGIYSPLALAMTGIMPELNGVFLSCGSLTDALTHEAYNRNFFRLNDNNVIRGRTQARLVKERFPEIVEWQAFMPDTETGRAAWAAFTSGMKTAMPDATLHEPVLFKWGSTDFKNQIVELMSRPLEGLFLAGLSGADAITLYQQAQPFGLAQKVKVYMDYGAELAFGQALGKRMVPNFWTVAHWYPGAYEDNAQSVALVEEYHKRSGPQIPLSFVGFAHCNVYALVQAIKTAGSSETDAVIAAMEGATFDTCRGNITVRKEDHQGLGDVNIIRVDPVAEDPGYAVTDFVRLPAADTAEPASPGVKVDFSKI